MSEPALLNIAGRQLETRHVAVSHLRGTIVLLHEALGSVSHWRDFPERDACEGDRICFWQKNPAQGVAARGRLARLGREVPPPATGGPCMSGFIVSIQPRV